MKKDLKLFNLRVLSEHSGISYNVLKNYSSGKKKEFSKEEIKKIEKTLSIFINDFFYN